MAYHQRPVERLGPATPARTGIRAHVARMTRSRRLYLAGLLVSVAAAEYGLFTLAALTGHSLGH
jgi:hypothetical protein